MNAFPSSSSHTRQPGQHLAMIAKCKGAPLTAEFRTTPTPGTDQILIAVRAIALNPVNYKMRDLGIPIDKFPVVLGSDVAGVIVSVGPSSSEGIFQPGMRVVAFATSFFANGCLDLGAFQELVLVHREVVCPIPDHITWNEGSLLPMSIATAWAGWYTAGIPIDLTHRATTNQGLLIWGASSSIGIGAVQTARSMGYKIYATASPQHHAMIRNLGAHKVFDYRDRDVVDNILAAVKSDGVTIDIGYDCVGAWPSTMAILKDAKTSNRAVLASAVRLTSNVQSMHEVEVKFILPPLEKRAQDTFYSFVFNVWLKQKLEMREYVPGPAIEIVPGGFGGINAGLDRLRQGVSGTKIVIEV